MMLQIPIKFELDLLFWYNEKGFTMVSAVRFVELTMPPIVVEAVPRKDYGSRVSNQFIPNLTYFHAEMTLNDAFFGFW